MRRHLTPLTPVATFFTAVSLAWTGYSVTDLIHSGTWGLLAAVSVDGLWAVVQYLDYKGIGGRAMKALGWAALAAGCTLLGYHAWSINWGAVIASVLPPVVAKIAWIGDIRLRHNPAALTPDEVATLAGMERGMVFEEREHDIRMRQQRMRAELLMSEVSTDFDIEVMRQDRTRDLRRRAPLAITASAPPDTPDKATDTRPDTSGQPDTGPDTEPRESALSSKDTRPDTPDILHRIASAASGPADLVRALSAHGVRPEALVSEAIRLRPDMVPDSIRRTAKRLGEGPYL